MHTIQPEKKTTDHEAQTRIYILSNAKRPVSALSNRRCQTIITTEPYQSIQTISALLQFVPQQEIDKGAVHEIQLPRAALLQWKLPLVSYTQVKEEKERRKIERANNITKGVLKKKELEINTDEWAALQALSHAPIMADQHVDQETQTTFTVRPHVLGDDQVAQLAEASSLQTSLTFDPDTSISAIQPLLTKEIDHFHTFLTTITPRSNFNSSEEDPETTEKNLVKEPVIIPTKDTFQTNEENNAELALCPCPPEISSPLEDPRDELEKPNTNIEQAAIDQFIDMLLSDLTDKTIPPEIKDILMQEFAEFTVGLPSDNVVTARNAGILSQTEDDEFEKVVAQIMNSCVYNIEDQLKRIMETFDTYQKDLKNMNRDLDNIQNEPQNPPTSPNLAITQENQDGQASVSVPTMEMQGDFSNLNREVDVLCECCQLTGEGAAVPTLGDPPVMGGKGPVTFDVILGQDGLELQNKATSSPASGEQVIRFSIVPSQPHVNQIGTTTPNSAPPNIFEIHLSRPNIPNVGNNLNTGPKNDCTVVLPPKRIMRTSEDNLDINGTSQKIGMMFEQDAEYIEPYINNVEDTTVPLNMLNPKSTPKKTRTIAKNVETNENTECTPSIEIPWELITLQIVLVEVEDAKQPYGCCEEFIDPLCAKKYCPVGKYHRNYDIAHRYSVDFEDRNEQILYDEEDDLDYEPAVTRKSIITASTSEIHGSMSDMFEFDEDEAPIKPRMQVTRYPVDLFVYAPKFERHNEPYMDFMFNHFPDDNMEDDCGSKMRIPWEVLTLPTNAKIRKAKKTAPNNASSNAKGMGEKANTDTTELISNINVPLRMAQDDCQSDFGIALNFTTDTISNIFFVDGAAASQKSVSNYSMMSDFRYTAKRCPKNISIGLNFEDGTIIGILAGSQTFEVADFGNNLSAGIMDIKPFTACQHNSEQKNIIKQKSNETVDLLSMLSRMPKETKSLEGNNVMAQMNVTANKAQSMPEIPSKGNVSFQRERAANAAPLQKEGKCKPPSPSNNTNTDPLASALEAYRAEMKPLREALDKLKEEVRELNLPPLMPNYYGGYPAPSYANTNYPAQYAGPSVRHTTAITTDCGTRTSTRMKPLFMQNMVGSQYNQLPYLPTPPGMPPMPYYLPSQQYPPMPYPVPGMVPYPQSPVNQQPSDLYSHHEYTPINLPSCKTRRRKKQRKTDGSVACKDSQLSQKISNSKPSCQANKCKNCGEDYIKTHYGPNEIVDTVSEVSEKAPCYIINNKYKIEIGADQTPSVQTDVTGTEGSHSFQITTGTHTETAVLPNSSPQRGATFELSPDLPVDSAESQPENESGLENSLPPDSSSQDLQADP